MTTYVTRMYPCEIRGTVGYSTVHPLDRHTERTLFLPFNRLASIGVASRVNEHGIEKTVKDMRREITRRFGHGVFFYYLPYKPRANAFVIMRRT